jgi:hypothetical protein
MSDPFFFRLGLEVLIVDFVHLGATGSICRGIETDLDGRMVAVDLGQL